MGYTLREALAAFRRAPLLTGLSAAMVGLALYVVGLFGLVAHNLNLALETVEERVEIVAYLRDGVLSDEILLARNEIGSLPEVLTVDFVTKDEALESERPRGARPHAPLGHIPHREWSSGPGARPAETPGAPARLLRRPLP